MGDSELLCNFRSCRRPLCDVAWVTFCSHIFCDVHGKPLSQAPVECPVCGSKLNVEIDVHRMIVNPSEHFRTMVLAGLKPSIVMEVCHRALTFWNYQKEQEHGYHMHVISKLRERLQQVETYYEHAMRTSDDRLVSAQRQLRDTQREHEKILEDMRATNEILADKTRKYQKLQVMYDTLRKRTGRIRTRSLSPAGNNGAAAMIEWPGQPPAGQLAIPAEDQQHHHQDAPRSSRQQQNVQLLNEQTQQQPNDLSTRPTSSTSYHLPVHYPNSSSLVPSNPYQQRMDLDAQATQVVPRSEVRRYHNPQQEYQEGGTSQSHSSDSVRPRELESFTLQQPGQYSSEDFTFRPAIFGNNEAASESQGGSGGQSRNDRRPTV